MLLSVIFTLKPEKETLLPAWQGRAAHAIFLDWVQKADPLLAKHLHDDADNKPFTVSNLMGSHSSRSNLNIHGECYLRFTTFGENLSNVLREIIHHSPPSEIFLENFTLKVKEVALDPEHHPWAGNSSYQILINSHLANSEKPPSRIDFIFVSPTTFRSQDRNFPLPLPGLVFGSLLEKWNAFAPVALNPELKRYAEECLAIARYSLYTRILAVAGGKQVGFLGNCRYIALNHDSYWLRQINLLADFAFYSGTGAKTTMGMGQTRRIK